MKIYLVTVKVGGSTHRYFDSIWVVEKHAEERARQLRDEFRRNGMELFGDGKETNMMGSAWATKVTTAICGDGRLDETTA